VFEKLYNSEQKRNKYDISNVTSHSKFSIVRRRKTNSNQIVLFRFLSRPIIDDSELSNDGINIEQMKYIDLSQIRSLELHDETNRRFIWRAKISYQDTNILIIIKDFTPQENIEEFKKYRFDQIKSDSTSNLNQITFQFSSHTRHDFDANTKF